MQTPTTLENIGLSPHFEQKRTYSYLGAHDANAIKRNESMGVLKIRDVMVWESPSIIWPPAKDNVRCTPLGKQQAQRLLL
jgi:hypothetical protein